MRKGYFLPTSAFKTMCGGSNMEVSIKFITTEIPYLILPIRVNIKMFDSVFYVPRNTQALK